MWGVRTPAEAEAKLAAVRSPGRQCRRSRIVGSSRRWAASSTRRLCAAIRSSNGGASRASCPPPSSAAFLFGSLTTTVISTIFTKESRAAAIRGCSRTCSIIRTSRIETGVDYFAEAPRLRGLCETLVYTGKIDEFFDYRYGQLDYRSLRFESEILDGDFQGAAIVNYTDASVPFTRIVEHKHFDPQPSSRTVITREFPQAYDASQTPYYPIRDARNTAIYERYRAAAAESGVLFGGRLGTYQYYDMHQVVAQAMTLAARDLGLDRPHGSANCWTLALGSQRSNSLRAQAT